MSPKEVTKLFATDCEISAFSAEMGRRELTVHVYPRKSEPGFIWILRGEMDLDDVDACVIDGGVVVANSNLNDAATIAVTRLFRYAATSQ